MKRAILGGGGHLRRAFSFDCSLDANSTEPLHRQLYYALSAAIRGGELPAGSRLPSSRRLAQRLRVSRNTVLAAFADLHADGLIAGRTGSGTWVGAAPRSPREQFDMRRVLRDAQFPLDARALEDPDGNTIVLHR